MTSKEGGHVDRPLRPASAPKLNMQRSQSRETITIQFSALGKDKDEEDEEEDLYGLSDPLTEALSCHEGVVTALEASEDLVLEGESEVTSGDQPNTNTPEQKGKASSGSSPSKSMSLPSMDKAFISLVKSLSSDLEPREGVPAPPSLRHRQLMKNLVKSLSTDTAQDPKSSSDSRLNLHLFKQFTQNRSSTSTADSKTIPASPPTSPDNRFSIKVSEVEAKLEDTKRRLTEAIADPLNLFSKLIGDEALNLYRPKPQSTSASELTSFSALNGHLESNNNYTIKEEEGDLDGDAVSPDPPEQASSTTPKPCPSSLALDKCSMSALAKQEDEEFCELYSEDFEICADPETQLDRTDDTETRSRSPVPPGQSAFSESEGDPESSGVPYKTLLALTLLVYGGFVLPFPTYVGGVLLGVVLGFALAVGVVWLTGPKRAGIRRPRDLGELWNVAQLDIKEPDIFKGWMNEIQNYDPETYHATLTHSVFVRLEGSTLRISKPNKNIARRASYSEAKPDVTYISQKIYDLTDSKVSLVPPGLARKRVWNKKYPICVELARQEDFMSKAELDRGSEENRESSGSGRGSAVVYLFGRTGREKEEWFRRITQASKLKSETAKKPAALPASRSAPVLSHSRSSSRSSLDELLSCQSAKRESLSGKLRPLLEYSTYMATYINPPKTASANPSPKDSPHSSPGTGKKLPSSPAKEKEEATVSWVNALIGRIAWDFLREQHWAEWVSKKIQMKLSKIRLPYFMNELTLTELDMGVGTPRILWASQPSVDHQGLWFDVEISYRGSFLMTLETKMNLSRLGKEGEGPGEFGKEGYSQHQLLL